MNNTSRFKSLLPVALLLGITFFLYGIVSLNQHQMSLFFHGPRDTEIFSIQSLFTQ